MNLWQFKVIQQGLEYHQQRALVGCVQDHLMGNICFSEFIMIQAMTFGLRSLQADLAHVLEFIQIQEVNSR